MKNTIKFCLYLLTFLSVYPLYARTIIPIRFKHIGLNEGLSQSTAVDIAQDKQGNLWIATHNGLNKFDGYDFTVYQHNEEDPYSIAGDLIHCCFTDSQGYVWVGTEEGLSLYNSDKERFENFTFINDLKKVPIHDIAEIDGQLLLCVRKEMLMLFDTHTMQLAEELLPSALSSVVPTAIHRQDSLVYIGMREGILIYDTHTGKSTYMLTDLLKGKEIYTILRQSPTRLWIGTEGDGLFRIDMYSQEATHYTHSPHDQHSISSNYIRSLCLDAQNRLWIGTLNSLSIYHEETDDFSVYPSNTIDAGSLSHSSVRDIFMDKQGGMWLGTYFGGLNYYHPLKERFSNILPIANSNSLNCGIIGCIREDARHNLWIGTNTGGINQYNPHNHTFTHYTRQNGLGSNDIKAIYIDEANDLVYIGTHTGGLSILNRQTGHIETICDNYTNNIYTLEPTENGELWISGISTLLRFNPRTKKFTTIQTQADGTPFLQTHITYIIRDSKHRLWMAGEKGVAVYTEHDGQLQECHLLPKEALFNHRAVNCVHESSHNGVFWIGTRDGLFSFNESTGKIEQLTVTHGLSNNLIHGIMEDSQGFLWISTDKGLSHFQPQTGKFRNYTDTDGLQSNQFANNAFCHSLNGQMYFGGINGITTFLPEQLLDNPYAPPVVLTRLRLFNQAVIPDDDNQVLTQSIAHTRLITLKASQSMFSIDFVVPNFISGNHNTFAYKLDGYDQQWYYTQQLRTASYSNLPQGTYRFLVKAANSDGKWNEHPTELEIVVLPVWYKTWWATILFILLFIAATIFIFYYFWMKKSMKAQIQLELADKERQKQLNEMKLQFFINISHELRTPLTLIVAPLQEILGKVSDRWIRNQLEHVQKNTNHLLRLVNQLMDYRRAELGVFQLKVSHAPVHEVIKKNFLLYEKTAERKQITYNLHSEVEDHLITCDVNYLELIINNLLSNAFKYTEEEGAITVILKEENNHLMLQVKDTGQGIPLDKQKDVFERFYQVDPTHVGTGIGLSLVKRLVELHHGEIKLESAEGVGSTFHIILPTNDEAYKPEEWDSANEQANSTLVRPIHHTELPIVEDKEETSTEQQKTDNGDKRKCILLVEDNPEIRQYLSDTLRQSYLTLEAENGEEALTLLKGQEVDLILTDVMMPVMDGLKLCKYIKQNLNTCHIPVIMLSAKTNVKEQLEGLQVGADDYIPKPFSIALVTTKIKNLFRTRHRAIEHYARSLEIEPEKVALNPIDEEFLKRAMEVVEKYIDEPSFSTDEFAREMLMSRSNLHLKLKALTGEPTNEFIRKMRFNKACKLLKEGKYSVAEISAMVGFNTPSYFSTSFKKYFGCLPSEYGK